MSVKYIPEPFRIKMVEPMRLLSKEERLEKIKDAKYNVFNLKSEDCFIDLLTDSGTNAMSVYQWAGMMEGDESYAGARSYEKLLAAGKDIFGYGYIQPVHQGRAAEKVLMPVLLSPGKYAISNLFFDTTRAHVILAGGRPLDCVSPLAKDMDQALPFKGNMDIDRLESLIGEYGADHIGLVVLTV
ncbi:MAG TPA: tyrosine phenol-lyase, partial [Clostridiaceae bacterium]|nr:tyrosine phenol-lyase [Clostridiaceae bacterium]